jgi:hypothetical protein
MTAQIPPPAPSLPPAPPEDYRQYTERVQQAYDEMFAAWLKESENRPPAD